MRSYKFIAVSAFVTATLFSASPLLAQKKLGTFFSPSPSSGNLWGNSGSSPRGYGQSHGHHPSSNNNSDIGGAIVKGIFDLGVEGMRQNNNNNNRYDRRDYYQPPRQSTYPPRNYYPTPAPTQVAPVVPKNVAPKKNIAPVKKVAAKRNNVMNGEAFLALSNHDIDRANEKLQEQQEEEIDNLEEDLKDQLPPNDTDLITQMNNANIDPAVQQQILDAKKRGDSATVQILYTANADPNHAGEAVDLANKINLQNDVNDLRDRNQNGKLRERDIDQFADKVKNVFPPGPQRDDLLAHLDDMNQTAEVQDLLGSAIPNAGMGGLGGGTVTVIHNPNLPDGTVINLGNGTMMVGTGGLGSLNVGTSSLAEAMGLPVAQSLPVPESDATIPTSGVVLRNASENGAEISYVINGKYDYSMQSGHIQTLGEGKWIILYDRGDSYGEAKYTLTRGTYEFTPSDNGWALFAKKYDVEIDNSGNPNEFHYVVNNVPAVVGPYSVKTHNSAYPLEVRFDRGDGKGEERKVLDGGTFQVAVSPNDNKWDLYSTDGIPVLAGDSSGGINLFGN
ncbi:hypothetical protein M4951_23945 [Blastopirellula sp. J2-11]|uniref:hypothetical protein n=1 Tax=Blastopirellula sp. J2-11 TaxID=2943192 RepID=UPI0021CADF67|nr:hypothetical protein [Blastopirellula sp. J2-11]UUO06386.1 hypothetical protein M4951_23945 [Blastopirellula sp. J2-11]